MSSPSSSSRIFEYFVVCGLGPEIRSLDGSKGYQGSGVLYMPTLLDQFPPSNHSLYPPPPPQLSTCVLPAGVELYSSGVAPNDSSTYPRCYPIVLTEGDGSKIYVSCIAFRDPVCQDIAEAHRIPSNSFADKCFCLVSRSPFFRVLRDALEELFVLCFSPVGSCWQQAGLGLPDTDAWHMIEAIAEKNNLGYKQLIKLRALSSHIQLLRIGYWGISTGKSQSVSYGLSSPRSQDASDESQQPAEASGVGRSWVQSMFSRDRSIRANSFSRVSRWTSDTDYLGSNDNMKPGASPRISEVPPVAQKKIQTSMRTLKGHGSSVTALHCVTRREVWDLFGDREDAGFFISGSTDCTIKIWDPSLRGSELRATLKGHTRPIRAISSDRTKVVSGSDDLSVIVWDKQTSQLLEELKGHDAPVSCIRMLSGERVLTASHDGTVKMWDVRTDTCVATVGRSSCAVLCMEYDDSTGILAAAGRDVMANIWDIRAGRQMHKLLGHTKWIRSVRMVGDTILTGSDDWTARVWSVSRGTCDAVLACHAGPILSVEHSPSDKGIITGSADGLIRFWVNNEGAIKCAKNITIHSASILSINAGEHWLGIGAADNSMSFFHRPQERLGGFSNTGSKMAGWQLYRTPQRSVAMVRCVASDLDRKRICSGSRNGLLRLWEATINI